MNYPGRVIRQGEADGAIVGTIANALHAAGYDVSKDQQSYDDAFAGVVSLYQSQHLDGENRPLNHDGEVGILTWTALFGAPSNDTAGDGLGGAALKIAEGQVGVLEAPKGSNRGKQVEEYQKAAGCPPGTFWCMAFVYWCFSQAAEERNVALPFPRTGGVLDAWHRVKNSHPGNVLSAEQALADPSLIRPGMVFILDHGGGMGHTGFVRSVTGGAFRTIEGNSNPDGSNNGIGVFPVNRRKVTSKELKGFIDFTDA